MILSQLSYIILAAVIVTSVINMSLNTIANKKNMFSIWQNVYLSFIIFHCIYVFFIRSFFKGDYYLDVGAPFVMFYPPFYYTAICTLNSPENFNFRKGVQNFYPGFLFVLFFFIICFFFKDHLKLQRLYNLILYGVGCLMFIIYGIISYIKYNAKSFDPAIVSLMKRSLILAVTITLVFSALIIATRKEIINHFNGVVVYLVMFFTVVILFRYNISVLNKRISDVKTNLAENQEQDIENEEADSPESDFFENKYKRSRITEKELQTYLMKVQKSLDEKIYLESELTLEKLSKQLNIPKYYLSQVFTLGFQENFNKLINKHRIEFAVALLQDKESNLTIEEIGLESGFNSRSSFYRTFNIYYQISPVDFRKNILENKG